MRIRKSMALLSLLVLMAGTAFGQHYVRTDLTADTAATSSTAANLDPNLINAWGLSRGSTSPWWVSDAGAGVTTLYNAAGVPQALVVKIPTPDGTGTSAPTGTVFNYSTGFEVAPGKPAFFLFVTEEGTIAGWNPVNGTTAMLVKDRSGKAIYKGAALARSSTGAVFLYATNFKTGRVDVFDSSFQLVASRKLEVHGGDDDHHHGRRREAEFVPFNIQNVGGNLVVTFAKREAGEEDELHGPGLGFVNIYSPGLRLRKRLQHGDFLNAPWGVALAPGDFGRFSHRLLIGNFGDGTVNAFNVISGKFEGKLLAADDKPIWIDGLWALSFAGGAPNNGSATELYFTAGPNDEANGLFGKLAAVGTEQLGNSE
jgi:uncharacterized protein (TIGR03118 family)